LGCLAEISPQNSGNRPEIAISDPKDPSPPTFRSFGRPGAVQRGLASRLYLRVRFQYQSDIMTFSNNYCP
jgi:hypothetical protein